MSAHNNICQKAEAAIVAYLATKTLGTIDAANIFAGMSRGTNADDVASEEASNPLPSVTVHADGGDESVPNTGVFAVNISVEVASNADDTDEDAHEENAGAVFDELVTDTFCADVTAAATDFTAMGVVYGAQSGGINGREWRSSLSLTLQCCGKSF